MVRRTRTKAQSHHVETKRSSRRCCDHHTPRVLHLLGVPAGLGESDDSRSAASSAGLRAFRRGNDLALFVVPSARDCTICSGRDTLAGFGGRAAVRCRICSAFRRAEVHQRVAANRIRIHVTALGSRFVAVVRQVGALAADAVARCCLCVCGSDFCAA